MYNKPLTIHSYERMIFLFDWQDPKGEIEKELLQFLNLVKAPEEIHTFEISPYSVWSAAAKGMTGDQITGFLDKLSLNRISDELHSKIHDWVNHFGNLKMTRSNTHLLLTGESAEIIEILLNLKEIKELPHRKLDQFTLRFSLDDRIKIKEILFQFDLFVIDSSNINGEVIDLRIASTITLKTYQEEAITAYEENMDKTGGGVLILPPGSGKTLVGLSVISKTRKNTLIIVEDDECANHWLDEIRDKTDFDTANVSFYNQHNNQINPITISTYAYLSQNSAAFQDMSNQDWGLIIFDDAHRLPADTYITTTDIPSKYKLALASTLARADQRGHLVFAVIGPKWYETYPKLLEKQGYLSPVECIEIRVPLSEIDQEKYNKARTDADRKRKIAAFNSNKTEALKQLKSHFWDKSILVVSYYVDLCKQLGQEFNKPIMLSDGSSRDYRDLVNAFENKEYDMLFGTSRIVEQTLFHHLDIIISLSYQQGSVREEYLRIGKLLGTKDTKQKKYAVALVSDGTNEAGDYVIRRREMVRLGYVFKIHTYEHILSGGGIIEN